MTAIAPTVDLAAAYRHCEEVTRREARNFSYGIRLLPTDKRQAMSAVYAFARRIDDIGDGDLPADEKLRLLADARAALATVGERTDDLVLVALADAAKRFPIPLPAFGELIEGVEMDVRGVRYESFDDLVHYCRCVAGSIGRLCLAIFGADRYDEAAPLADALGVALQQTNILRDIREDLGNGRIYLPQQDLRRFGVDLQLAADGTVEGPRDRLVDLIEDAAARAETWYADGLRLLPMLDRRSAACCAAMSGIYRRLLARIEETPEVVLRERMSLSAWEKMTVAARSLAGART
ncbi:MAG TPA: presqualene diphosphate synthase HpnD [Mycobacteriales bacterium]|jgi:phytoene synthase|nr:presqualene diphosphate synthase HpnD [Mycobacteriales bacterium]